MSRYNLTQGYLKTILHYCRETGIWTWLYSNGAATIGKRAGCLTHKGYLVIRINGYGYEAQLLAYLYIEGKFPPDNHEIDHIDKDVGNNKYCNYRLVTKAQNQWNAKLSSRSTTGIKGLTRAKDCYLARISINGIRVTKRFSFDKQNEAITYLTSLRNQLHGEFANHG